MRLLTSVLTAFLLFPTVTWSGERVHPYDFPQRDEAPDEVYAVIEIPAGSFTKYEIDVDTGHMMVDRFVRMPVAYPANYGSITQTVGGDGDPLDVLVFTREPLHPGVIIKVRPVAILKTLDGGEVDDKIIAVPASDIDPSYNDIQDMRDLPPDERGRLEAFFRVYKQMRSDNPILIKDWADVKEAKKMILKAVEDYKEAHDESDDSDSDDSE